MITITDFLKDPTPSKDRNQFQRITKPIQPLKKLKPTDPNEQPKLNSDPKKDQTKPDPKKQPN